MHIWQEIGAVHREEITTDETTIRTNFNSIGARAPWLRERINASLRSIGQSLAGFGEKHEQADKPENSQNKTSSRSDRNISNRIRHWLKGLSKRVTGLRRDRSKAEQQLGASLQRGAKLEKAKGGKQSENQLER